MKKLTNIQLTPRDLSEKAFNFYSTCSLKFSIDNHGYYYIDDVMIFGDIEDLNEYLEFLSDDEKV